MNDPFMRNQAVQARPKVQNRSNVLQLKLMGQSHPTGLTPNLLKLFEPRPPLEFLPPPEKRKCPPYTGMAQFVSHFAEPGDPKYAPPKPEVETPAQKRERIHKSRLEKGVEKAAEDLQKYDPNNDPNASGDPYKTLFVARLNYETSESKIKREFEAYGPIKQVHLVTDQQTNKPKGYAFIEYLNTRDMKAAYKQGDGKKIDGRRVLVDVERGRTVPNWRPRRLGGGLGTTRVTGEKIAGKEEQQQPSQARTSRPRSLKPVKTVRNLVIGEKKGNARCLTSGLVKGLTSGLVKGLTRGPVNGLGIDRERVIGRISTIETGTEVETGIETERAGVTEEIETVVHGITIGRGVGKGNGTTRAESMKKKASMKEVGRSRGERVRGRAWILRRA
ncbi:hypothetical protein Bca52824_060625 [Brassica carinata]|uniref:U1 small nuclear ribonucleoprotein 70 kDa n=1 Tax=Brassica carinata TaxID=52824 RepID=A0A8X7UFS8_BRACI|nr:hypothetical protein Bca52824_060625 [Brassica carinata]